MVVFLVLIKVVLVCNFLSRFTFPRPCSFAVIFSSRLVYNAFTVYSQIYHQRAKTLRNLAQHVCLLAPIVLAFAAGVIIMYILTGMRLRATSSVSL